MRNPDLGEGEFPKGCTGGGRYIEKRDTGVERALRRSSREGQQESPTPGKKEKHRYWNLREGRLTGGGN